MGKADDVYTPEQRAILRKMVIDYTPEQRAAIRKPTSNPKSKSEKKLGPQVSRAIPILIKLYPPAGIPLVTLQAAYWAVNKRLTERKELPVSRDSVRRAVLVLKERNAQ